MWGLATKCHNVNVKAAATNCQNINSVSLAALNSLCVILYEYNSNSLFTPNKGGGLIEQLSNRGSDEGYSRQCLKSASKCQDCAYLPGFSLLILLGVVDSPGAECDIAWRIVTPAPGVSGGHNSAHCCPPSCPDYQTQPRPS